MGTLRVRISVENGRVWLGVLALLCMRLCCSSVLACGQQAGSISGPDLGRSAEGGAGDGFGSVFGSVVDASGAIIPGARVTLLRGGESVLENSSSAEAGAFAFEHLRPGVYRMEVQRSGFTARQSTVALTGAQPLNLGEIALAFHATEVLEVRASGRDIAEAQLELEEKQRVLGVFPNFYASYREDAEPMSAGEKFRLAERFSIDPVAFMVAGVTAGSEQRANTFPGYGPGELGFARRFGAAYTDGLTSTLLGQAVFPALLHQDPRYFVKGTGTVRSRLLYAVASMMICKGDNRRKQVNYSNVLGNFASAGLSNAYYPAASRGAALLVQNALTATGMGAVGGLFQEFLLHRMTPRLPEYGGVQ